LLSLGSGILIACGDMTYFPYSVSLYPTVGKPQGCAALRFSLASLQGF